MHPDIQIGDDEMFLTRVVLWRSKKCDALVMKFDGVGSREGESQTVTTEFPPGTGPAWADQLGIKIDARFGASNAS